MLKRIQTLFLVLLLLVPSAVGAFNFGKDLKENTEIHLLDNILPSSFFDVTRGDFYGGVLTEVLSYRFLGALVGVQKNLEKNRKYEPVLSTGLRLDYFGNHFLRKVSSQSPLFSRMAIGPYVGYTFAENRLIYGLAATVKFKIPHQNKQ